MSNDEIKLDFERTDRLGFGEAILCEQKSTRQISAILDQAETASHSLLLTRLSTQKLSGLPANHRARIDFDETSGTAFFRYLPHATTAADVAVVAAGTSDAPAAREALRTLEFNGVGSTAIFDVGVAGLWRLMDRIDEIKRHTVVIAVAGMDAALPSVLGGLVPGVLIAVPTSAGYGMARDGETALAACLASCAPGVTVCNIDNGYGAACAALRVLNAIQKTTS